MSQFFSDIFTGTTGVTIQSRNANVGTWALLAGSANAQLTAAGRARPSASGFPVYFANVTPVNADYEVQADFFFASVVGTVGIYVRVDATGANDYNLSWDTATSQWHLFKDVGGSSTSLAASGTPVPTAGSTHTGLIRAHGTTIAAWVDGVLLGSVTDTTGPSAANRAGFFQNGSATPSDSLDVHFDNYLAFDTQIHPHAWRNPLLPQ